MNDYPNSPYPLEPAASPQVVRVQLPQRVPYVTYGILAFTVLIYLGQVGSDFIFGQDWLILLGVKYEPLIRAGQLWRLFTPMLLHGSLLHIGFNMYALFQLGPSLETYWGHARFALLYVLAGFAGNVLSLLMSPNPSLGASTAVFGLLAAQAVFLYRSREIFGEAAGRALGNVVVIALVNFFIGLSPGIDNWGHLGGFLGGGLLAWFGGPWLFVQLDMFGARLNDSRTTADTLRAALWVFMLFAALAAGYLILF